MVISVATRTSGPRHVVNPKPNIPKAYKTGAEKSRQLLASFQWFSFFPGSSFFVVWNSSHGFLGQKFGLVDDMELFPKCVCVFFLRKESVFRVVTSSCFWGPNAESWKKKGRAHIDAAFCANISRMTFECACQMASKLEITVIEVESESNKVLTGYTQLLSRISYLPDDQWTNGKQQLSMILTGGHLFIGKCPMSYPRTSHRCRTQNNYKYWKQRLTRYHLIWLSPDIVFFHAPQTQAMHMYESTEYLDPLKGRPFFFAKILIHLWRLSSDSWSKNPHVETTTQTSSPKNSTQRSKNIIKNLRWDGIEQWNFNQLPTTPGVPPAAILTGSLFVKWLRWYERDHHAVSMCTSTWCVLQGWNCRAISVFRNGWSCSDSRICQSHYPIQFEPCWHLRIIFCFLNLSKLYSFCHQGFDIGGTST